MGWDVPEMYIEQTLNIDDEKPHWTMIAKPWFIFSSLEYCKTFLLGYGKYGSQPGWEPARELKGLPKYPSRDVAQRIEMDDHEVLDATWLSLSELESIDLDEPMGLPDDIQPILRRPGRYFDFTKLVDGDEEYIDPRQLDDETIRMAFENENPIEYGNGSIQATHLTRRNYASGFDAMLRLMRDLSEGNRYRDLAIPADHIRLVIWVTY